MVARVQNNLPPQSQPWARTVESMASQAAFDANKAVQDNTTALKNINATLTALSKQVSVIAAQQDDIAAVVADLDAAVRDISDLSANQVTAKTGNAQAGYPAFTAPTTFTDYATVTLAVPVGYTKANIMAVSSFLAVSGGAESYQHITTINGISGPLGSASTIGEYESISNSNAVSLTGLTSSNFIVASTTIKSAASAGTIGGISTSVVVTFLK